MMVDGSVYERKDRVRRVARRVGDLLSAISPRRGSPESTPPHRIGVLLQWGIGDAVLALPLLRGLREAYPEASIELASKPWLAELFAGEACADRAHLLVPPWTKYQGKYRISEADWRRFAGQLRVLRQTRFELLIGIRFDPREVLQLRLLNARETAGFGSTGGRHWVTRDIGHTAEKYNDRHRSEVSAHALEALTGLTRWSIPHFQLDEAERDRALNWLRHVGYRGGPILAVHTGAGHPIRCWGDENFNAVLKALPGAVQFVTVIDDGSRKGGQDIRVPNTVPSCVWRGGFAGGLVPEALRHRWRLHRGVSKRALPKLLPQLGNVDIFVHDSLHTSRNMRWEFQSVAPYLGPRSVVIADDAASLLRHDRKTRYKAPLWG